MNKYIAALLSVIVLVPSISFAQTSLPGDYPPTTSSQNCLILSSDLTVGSRDTAGNRYAVSSLQNFLALNGYYNQDPTGYFGIVTRGAVESF